MPAPAVVRAEIRCDSRIGFGLRGTFVADVTALAQGFVVRKVHQDADTEYAPKREALPGGPVTINQAESGTGMVEQAKHVLGLTITTACYVDDQAGVYVVPHDHLKIIRGADQLRAMRLPTAGNDMSEAEIAKGIRRYRDILQKQVDDLNSQLHQFDTAGLSHATVKAIR